MASQLPYPYPDELFYSVAARYLAYFPPESVSAAIMSMAGKRWCSIGFGHGLDQIAKSTHSVWGLSAQDIVERHTLLPFYGAFLEPDVYLERVQRMCARGETTDGVGPGDLRHSVTMRYCPICASDDIAKFGESFWHRRHQLPGALLCTLHDTILLRAPEAYARKPYDATLYIKNNRGKACAELTPDEYNLAREISRRSVGVLDGECNKWTKIEVRAAYDEAARDHGFNVGAEKIDTFALTENFIRFFGGDFLRKIGFRTGKFLFHSGGSKDPLANVLVQMFFEAHVEDRGFDSMLATTPLFGWKCPNEHAKHPASFRVANVVKRKSRLGYSYFHAKCSCGLSFAFFKARDEDPLMPDEIKVSRWSPFQQEHAQALFERHLSVRAVASAMKVSHRTASKLISCEMSKFELSPTQVDRLRRDWETDPSRATYQALLKHDRQWLLAQKDGRRVPRLPVPVSKDAELALSIREAFALIGSRGERPTLHRLSNELGLRIVRSSLEAYPLSMAEVLAACPAGRGSWNKKGGAAKAKA